MYAQIWAAYRTDTNNNPFGRDFASYCGWQTNAADAMAEAIKRNPDIDPKYLQVNVA